MKQCSKCLKRKPYSEFHKKKQIHDGYAYHCKDCVRNYDQKRIDNFRVFPKKEKDGLIHCRYCEQYLDKSKFWGKLTYCKDCSKTIGHSNNIKRFGLSVDRCIRSKNKKNGLCAICKNPETNKRRLSVDHDHSCCPGSGSCGKCIRGLLCSNCNTFLGNAKDNIDTLKAAIEYLEK